uniref:60S ribosomal protein L28-like n=1 Tax=Myodes glareolus TaxID=447135 RepID=UPI002021C329|nr:60S ribosomal protein L28-like [Myodes glareolus]
MCVHLQWMVVWYYCNFLIRRNKHTCPEPIPNTLKFCNSVHYNRLIYCKTVGVEPMSKVL